MRLVSIIIAVFCVSQSLTVGASEVPCADSKIVVVAKSDVDREDICLAARKALTFLEPIGLGTNDSVTCSRVLFLSLPL